MSIDMDQYRESLESIAPEMSDILESHFHEAARVMSAPALQE